MTALKPLSPQRHGSFHWRRAPDWRFAETLTTVPITAMEVQRAMGHLPLAFMPRGDGFAFAALLSVDNERNALVDAKGRWQGDHVPGYLGTYPFRIVETEDGRQVVAVDEDSGLVGAAIQGGEPLFQDDGQPTPTVQRAVEFLGRLAKSRMATDRACARLAEHGLIEPWPLEVDTPKGKRNLRGLHRINNTALDALDPETLAALRDSGALSLAYAQLLSANGIAQLRKQARTRTREAEQTQRQTPTEAELFPGVDDGLQFDWDALDGGPDPQE